MTKKNTKAAKTTLDAETKSKLKSVLLTLTQLADCLEGVASEAGYEALEQYATAPDLLVETFATQARDILRELING